MNKHRYRQAAPATQYELGELRDAPRRTRYQWQWSSLSDTFHPHSQAEWDAYIDKLEAEHGDED